MQHSKPLYKAGAVVALLATLILGIHPSAIARPNPVQWQNSDWVTVAPRTTVSLYSRCPNDRIVVSGGFHSQSASGNRGFKVIDNYAEDAWTWRVRLRNTNDSARQVKIQRICIKPSEF